MQLPIEHHGENRNQMNDSASLDSAPPVSTAPISILIIEDDEDDYLHLREFLCELGHQYFHIDWSKSFESGLTALMTHSYDVCLLDYQLGTRTGLDLLYELSKHQHTTTAILMVTGTENIDIDIQAIQSGAMDYLVKGELNSASIKRAVRHALSHRLNQLALKDYAIELEHKNQELAIARDEALSGIRLKSEFLSNMSHETRTPLTGIIGLIRMLKDTTLTTDQRETLDTIEECTDALLFMLNNILDFSRIEDGQFELQHIAFDIRTTIEETITHLTPLAQRNKLELLSLIHANVPTIVNGDPSRFRQILNNLIGNAIKFSENGEIKIQAVVEPRAGQDVFVTLSVTDCGVGMSEGEKKNLFIPFTQGDGSSKRKYPGAGLGLAVTKHVTERMGGTIGVDSTLGEGSRFWVTIPFQRPNEEKAEIPAGHIDIRGRRAALLSSDPAQYAFFKDHCQEWGVMLASWPTAEQGLHALQDAVTEGTTWDVVIIDNSLPDLNAFLLAERIKADTALSDLPLVLLTDGKPGEAKKAKDIGMVAYLTKPTRAWQIQDCFRWIAHTATKDPINDAQEPSTLITKHSLADARAREKTRVLLVEENAVNQKVLIRALEKLGHRVDVVSSVSEATTAVGSNTYHVVLLDEWLSEFDQDAMGTLNTQLTNDSIPLILMTNTPTHVDHTGPRPPSMMSILAKPIKLEDLDEVITQEVGKNTMAGSHHHAFTPVSEHAD